MNLGKYLNMREEEEKKYFETQENKIVESDTISISKMNYGSGMRQSEDGKIVNQKFLIELQSPEMCLYGIDDNYFETLEELEQYCGRYGISTDKVFTLEYFRTFAGRSDVIRKTYPDGMRVILTVADEFGFGIYNHERSVRNGEFIWEFSEGNIESYYTPFQERGVLFEEDVYGKINERNKQFLKSIREHNYFRAGEVDKESSN